MLLIDSRILLPDIFRCVVGVGNIASMCSIFGLRIYSKGAGVIYLFIVGGLRLARMRRSCLNEDEKSIIGVSLPFLRFSVAPLTFEKDFLEPLREMLPKLFF